MDRPSVRRYAIAGLGMTVAAVLLLSTGLVRHRRMHIHSQRRHVQLVIRHLSAAVDRGPGLATAGIAAPIQVRVRFKRALMADGQVGEAVR